MMVSADAAPISVIMPVRNAVAHLPAALDSVTRQSPRPGEILVIDGGSTDGSREVAAARPETRVIRQVGSGLAAARNQGIRASRFPWIAFCDADDCWCDTALPARVAALEQNPVADAVIGRVVLHQLPGTTLTAAQTERLGRIMMGFTPGALLVRRAVFEEIGWFDERMTIGADSDWFVRLHQSRRTLLSIEDLVLQKGARATSLSADVATYRRELLTVARRFIERRRLPDAETGR